MEPRESAAATRDWGFAPHSSTPPPSPSIRRDSRTDVPRRFTCWTGCPTRWWPIAAHRAGWSPPRHPSYRDSSATVSSTRGRPRRGRAPSGARKGHEHPYQDTAHGLRDAIAIGEGHGGPRNSRRRPSLRSFFQRLKALVQAFRGLRNTEAGRYRGLCRSPKEALA